MWSKLQTGNPLTNGLFVNLRTRGLPSWHRCSVSGMSGAYEKGRSCLEQLWTRESGWRWDAENPDGAYGIPQAFPGSKMGSAGADWRTDPTTQIKWGLTYITDTYGTPCGAWNQE